VRQEVKNNKKIMSRYDKQRKQLILRVWSRPGLFIYHLWIVFSHNCFQVKWYTNKAQWKKGVLKAIVHNCSCWSHTSLLTCFSLPWSSKIVVTKKNLQDWFKSRLVLCWEKDIFFCQRYFINQFQQVWREGYVMLWQVRFTLCCRRGK
jgi:hypothetical protein